MAVGKPVVAVNAGGVPEIITDPEVGVLVPLGDVAACTHAVLRLLRDPERAKRLGNAAHLYATRQFDVQAVTRRVEAIYASVLPPVAVAGLALHA
jgi:glycosyltransferase involved in cell wall biosynthesis